MYSMKADSKYFREPIAVGNAEFVVGLDAASTASDCMKSCETRAHSEDKPDD